MDSGGRGRHSRNRYRRIEYSLRRCRDVIAVATERLPLGRIDVDLRGQAVYGVAATCSPGPASVPHRLRSESPARTLARMAVTAKTVRFSCGCRRAAGCNRSRAAAFGRCRGEIDKCQEIASQAVALGCDTRERHLQIFPVIHKCDMQVDCSDFPWSVLSAGTDKDWARSFSSRSSCRRIEVKSSTMVSGLLTAPPFRKYARP